MATETDTAERFQSLLQQLVDEIHAQRRAPRVQWDQPLDDLGLDSLSRLELLLRIEQDLGMSIDQDAALDRETPREWLDLLGVEPQREPSPPPSEAPEATRIEALPETAATLGEVLAFHAEHHAERRHLLFYAQEDRTESLTYGELHADAQRVAGHLRRLPLEPGDTVALILPSGLDFFRCFYGILLAGGVPVPLYPPTSRARILEFMQRQVKVLDNAGARLLITSDEIAPFADRLHQQVASLQGVHRPEQYREAAPAFSFPGRSDALALLQYTSGSTGIPKGVMLTHANLLANIRAMGEAIAASSDDVFVSWLPLYHDMGLIGACLGSLYYGVPLVLMSPLAFIAKPIRWLRLIHQHGGTLSAAPNFAYQLCATRLQDADLEGLDLSSWRVAFNGAEPVHAETLDAFIERFGPYGLRREALSPVYGLAESAVGLAFPPLTRGPRVDCIDREQLASADVAEPVAADHDRAMPVVSGGHALPGHELRVVDTADRPLAERRQGSIQFRGPSATQGYYRNPEASAELCHGDWRETGDNGYLADGEVFVTGRSKDVIIRAGRNLYPYELEQAVGDLDGIRKGAVAVFAADPGGGRAELLVVLAETREQDEDRLQALRDRIHRLANELLETPADDVVLAPPRTVLKTSSGKIRRGDCRALYEAGKLTGAAGRSPQDKRLKARLYTNAAATFLRRQARRTAAYLYAGWGAIAFVLCALVFVPLILVSPSRALAQRLAHRGARTFFLAAGIPLEVRHPERFPDDPTVVVVANHASYLDAFILAAAFARPMHFVAKEELAKFPPLRWFLYKLGNEFVSRQDIRRSVADSERLLERVRGGDGVVFFPEGGFTPAAGLRAFKLGAFRVAIDTRSQVLPVAIEGARNRLRGNSLLLRRGRIVVHTGEPIAPPGEDWQAIIALRDQTRDYIRRHCGEPDLLQE